MSDAGTSGWYPDPYRRHELRYYNGLRWTGDVSTHGRRMVDPVQGGQAAPGLGQPGQPFGSGGQQVGTKPPLFGGNGAAPFGGGGTQFGGPPFGDGQRPASQPGRPGWSSPTAQWSAGPPPGAGSGPPVKRGTAIAAFVIAVSSAAIGWFPFAFTVAGAGVVLAVVFGLIGLRRAKAQGGAGRGFATAALAISPVALAACVGGFFFTRFVVHEIDAYDHPGRYELTQDHCAPTAGSVTFSGSIHNLEPDTRSYQLTLSYGVGGRQLATEYVAVDDVRAGETAQWTDVQRLDPGAGDVACEVVKVHGPLPLGIRPG